MALPGVCTLTCAGVNSGSALDMNITNISVSIPALTTVPNKPARTRTAVSDMLTTGRNVGIGAPSITISGVYIVNGSHETGASAAVDWEHILGLLLESDVTMTLTCDRFKTTANTTGAISVMLQDYADNYPNSNTVDYTMVFTQVSS